jgi:hypothetical protein
MVDRASYVYYLVRATVKLRRDSRLARIAERRRLEESTVYKQITSPQIANLT